MYIYTYTYMYVCVCMYSYPHVCRPLVNVVYTAEPSFPKCAIVHLSVVLAAARLF